MIVDEMRDALQEQYGLDDAVVDRAEFIYKTKIGNKGNEKDVRICDGNARLEGIIRTHDNSNLLAENSPSMTCKSRLDTAIETR